MAASKWMTTSACIIYSANEAIAGVQSTATDRPMLRADTNSSADLALFGNRSEERISLRVVSLLGGMVSRTCAGCGRTNCALMALGIGGRQTAGVGGGPRPWRGCRGWVADVVGGGLTFGRLLRLSSTKVLLEIVMAGNMDLSHAEEVVFRSNAGAKK